MWITLALACQARLLIADEPTTALDVVNQARAIAVLRRYGIEHGASILLITHDLPVAASFCDRAIVLQHGRVVEQGSMAGLSHGYRTPARGLSRRRTTVPSLAGVSFSVGRGKTVGLVGRSGSGKSTLIRVLLALERPAMGELRLGDRRVQDVPPDPAASLEPRMSVEQLVGEPLRRLGIIGDHIDSCGRPSTTSGCSGARCSGPRCGWARFLCPTSGFRPVGATPWFRRPPPCCSPSLSGPGCCAMRTPLPTPSWPRRPGCCRSERM